MAGLLKFSWLLMLSEIHEFPLLERLVSMRVLMKLYLLTVLFSTENMTMFLLHL